MSHYVFGTILLIMAGLFLAYTIYSWNHEMGDRRVGNRLIGLFFVFLFAIYGIGHLFFPYHMKVATCLLAGRDAETCIQMEKDLKSQGKISYSVPIHPRHRSGFFF